MHPSGMWPLDLESALARSIDSGTSILLLSSSSSPGAVCYMHTGLFRSSQLVAAVRNPSYSRLARRAVEGTMMW